MRNQNPHHSFLNAATGSRAVTRRKGRPLVSRIRIHRSVLVSTRRIQALHPDDGGQLAVELRDQGRTRLIVSKGRAAHVKARLGL